jgi:hypothetical protein
VRPGWSRFSRIAAAVLALAGAGIAAPLPGRAGDGPPPDEGRPVLESVRDRYDDAHFDRCGASSTIVLNEVCSVGTECDPDVRVADFVEVYNPSGAAVDLSCFVLVSAEAVPFVPEGSLAPGAVAAWSEAELGFRLAKVRDRVRLYRMHADGGTPGLRLIDLVEIADFRAAYRRVPDGGPWRSLSVEEAEAGGRTTFNAPNS